jgi:hypothetical protein
MKGRAIANGRTASSRPNTSAKAVAPELITACSLGEQMNARAVLPVVSGPELANTIGSSGPHDSKAASSNVRRESLLRIFSEHLFRFAKLRPHHKFGPLASASGSNKGPWKCALWNRATSYSKL